MRILLFCLFIIYCSGSPVQSYPKTPPGIDAPIWKSCDDMRCIDGFVCIMKDSDVYRGPLCVKAGDITCANTLCDIDTQCIHVEVGCDFEPCFPAPKCVSNFDDSYNLTPLKCEENEEINNCGAYCENKCEALCEPQACILICGPPACACKKDYYRDPHSGKCVSKDACPKCPAPTTQPPPPDCILPCPFGYRCQIVNGNPECVPPSTGTTPCTTTPLCRLPCPLGATCEIIDCKPQCVLPSTPPMSTIESTEPTPTCGKNEIYSSCTSLCGGICRTLCPPIPFCPALCGPPGCQCIENFFKNNDGVCVHKDKCPPCPPVTDAPSLPESSVAPMACILDCIIGYRCILTPSGPECVPINDLKCAKNEEVNMCGAYCENKCESLCELLACPAICGPPACACKKEFYRDPSSGDCVSKTECPKCKGSTPPPSDEVNPCAFTTCLAPSDCIVVDGKAKCVAPNTGTNPCARTTCLAPSDCIVVKGEAQCVPLGTGNEAGSYAAK